MTAKTTSSSSAQGICARNINSLSSAKVRDLPGSVLSLLKIYFHTAVQNTFKPSEFEHLETTKSLHVYLLTHNDRISHYSGRQLENTFQEFVAFINLSNPSYLFARPNILMDISLY